MTQELARLFKVPLIEGQKDDDAYVSGDSAGNIMGTHDGKLVIGDSMSPDLQRTLQNHTKSPLTKLPAEWLYVAHIDEYLSILPSRGRCGAALAYASPLRAFEVILQEKFQPEELLFTSNPQQQVKFLDLRNSIRKFLKNKDKTSGLTAADFVIGPEMNPLIQSRTDELIASNLWIARERIHPGVKAMQDGVQSATDASRSAACYDELIPLPQLYRAYDSAVTDWDTFSQAYYTSLFPGAVNLVSLRDYIIVPNPWTLPFQRAVSLALTKVIDPEKIFFADTRHYSRLLGEIHCGTNVIRDPLHQVHGPGK